MREVIGVSDARLSRRLRTLLAAGALAIACALPARADDANQILKTMTDYIGGQKTLSATFEIDLDIITPDIEKLQFSGSGQFQISRPNRLHVVRTGGYSDVALFFDGETATVLDRAGGSYGQVKATGDLDQLFDLLDRQYGLITPGADLLMAGAFSALTAGVIEAKHIGRGVIDGIECHHLAFRNADTDWQIWVQVGDRPLPMKYVIVSKTMAAGPAYSVRMRDWKVGAALDSKAFVFVPPKGAKSVPLASLRAIGELPEFSPAGGKP